MPTPSNPQSVAGNRRYLARWLLAGIVLAAAFLRYGGFDRPAEMHPDQPRILSWMERTEQDGYLKNTVYPGGFFTLFNQFRRAVSPVLNLQQHWRYQLNEIDRVTPPRDLHLSLGRHFNVWLAAATCALIYLMAAGIARSWWAGLYAAALFCLAPEHIIHAHYVQTDIAMVFTLTLALWLWACFAGRRALWLFAAAALASGFAAGTKYTLLCLAPLGWIFSFYAPSSRAPGAPAAGAKPQAWRRIIVRMILATVLFAAGFSLATPEILDWHAFQEGLRYQNMRVYGEGATILNQARGEPLIALRSHCRQWCAAATVLGWGSLLSAAAGLWLAGTFAYRRYWPVLLGFPLCYLYYYLFRAPWVRGQEFMNFFPAWAVLAGLLPLYLWRRWQHPAGRRLGRAAALILILATFLPLFQNGLIAASAFKWKDTRYLANRWLQRHLPANYRLGLERYTDPAQVGVGQGAAFIHKIETASRDLLENRKYDAILRNPSSDGRGLRHPVTGRRYSKYQTAFDGFTNRAVCLRAWSVLPPNRFASPFTSPDLELWLYRPAAPELELQLPLAQPGYISHDGRETYCRAGHESGSADLLLIDRYPRECAFAGPAELPRPVYALVNTLERPAEFYLRGFGRRFKQRLPPYQAAAIPLQRPWWRPRLDGFERLAAATRPEPHIEYIPCLLRAAFDAPAAAALLQQMGHPGQALALLQSDPDRESLSPALVYPLAVANAQWDLAAQWEPCAAELRARLQQALALSPESISVNGINGWHYNQCARIRLTPGNGCSKLELAPDRIGSPETLPGLPPGATLDLSARLARGIYTVAMNLRAMPEHGAGSFAVYDSQGRKLAEGPWQDVPDDLIAVEFTLAVGRESDAWLHFTSTIPAVLEYRDLEIRWDMHDQIRAVYNALTAALAQNQLHAGQAGQALALLAEAAPPCWNDLEFKRLELAALQADAVAPERLAQAARRILQAAPDYYPALNIIQPETAARRPANLPHPVLFPPFLALVGVRAGQAEGGAIELIFEARDDGMPSLAAASHHRRGRRGWRKDACRPIGPECRRLTRGERVSVRFDQEKQMADGRALSDIGISIQANVRWSPGTLKPAGRSGPVIAVSELVQLLNPENINDKACP